MILKALAQSARAFSFYMNISVVRLKKVEGADDSQEGSYRFIENFYNR